MIPEGKKKSKFVTFEPKTYTTVQSTRMHVSIMYHLADTNVLTVGW